MSNVLKKDRKINLSYIEYLCGSLQQATKERISNWSDEARINYGYEFRSTARRITRLVGIANRKRVVNEKTKEERLELLDDAINEICYFIGQLNQMLIEYFIVIRDIEKLKEDEKEKIYTEIEYKNLESEIIKKYGVKKFNTCKKIKISDYEILNDKATELLKLIKGIGNYTKKLILNS